MSFAAANLRRGDGGDCSAGDGAKLASKTDRSACYRGGEHLGKAKRKRILPHSQKGVHQLRRVAIIAEALAQIFLEEPSTYNSRPAGKTFFSLLGRQTRPV